MVCHYVFENCNIVQFALQLNNFAEKIAKTITHGVIIILLPLPHFKIKSQLNDVKQTSLLYQIMTKSHKSVFVPTANFNN